MSGSSPSAQGYVPLPLPLTSFVGRDREVASVIGLLQRPDLRLLTLTGPGGIGKTRFALRVSDHHREHYVDGITFVSLAPLRDARLVLPAIAQALQVPDSAGQALLDAVVTCLAERDLLLLLDNLEHLLDAAAPLVASLLARCPNLTVLATSRTRLGISGEQVMPLPPLDGESARALFAARASAADPRFAVTAENAPVIDAICERLDRLPLAVELSAARIPVLPPAAMLARLEQRLPLLVGGPRDAPDRQRDMRAAIAWSYDLLPTPQQQLFCRLGVFVGGFSLGAAQEVAGDGEDVLAAVSALVAASLVNPAAGAGDEPRLSMLETVREFALEQLAASGEDASVRERHARAMVAFAETAWNLPTGPASETGTRNLWTEIGNLRVALDWTLAHDPDAALQLAGALMECWIWYVRLTEARVWIERALEAAPRAPSRVRARALLAGGWVAMDQEDFAQADRWLAEAVTRAREATDDPKVLIRSLGILGVVAVKVGDLPRARRLFEEQRTHVATEDTSLLAHTTLGLGQVAMAMGDLADAQALFEEALAIHQSGSGPSGVGLGHQYLGMVTLARGDRARAAAAFREAISQFTEVGGPWLVARAVEGLAGVFATRQPDAAARLLGAASTLRQQDDRARDPIDLPAYEATVATTRSALGEPAFSTAWESGATEDWDELLAGIDTLIPAIVADGDGRPQAAATYGLSPRERDVLRLLVEGKSNRAIGDALSISERTVENHVVHILAKLDLDSRTAAATWAVRQGLA